VVMDGAIRWHVNTRAMFDDPDKSLEFVIGTRWAVHDLYSYIMQNDPTVSTLIRSIVENGKTIYPEAFTLETVARLRKEFGVMFALMFMNNTGDPDLVDFTEEDLRFFSLLDGQCIFDEDLRDHSLEANIRALEVHIERGQVLDEDVMAAIGSAQDTYFRFRSV